MSAIDHVGSVMSLARTLRDGLDRRAVTVAVDRAQIELIIDTFLTLGGERNLMATKLRDAQAEAVKSRTSAFSSAASDIARKAAPARTRG